MISQPHEFEMTISAGLKKPHSRMEKKKNKTQQTKQQMKITRSPPRSHKQILLSNGPGNENENKLSKGLRIAKTLPAERLGK